MEFLGWGGSLVFTFMFVIHIARMKNRVTTVLLPDATYFSLAVIKNLLGLCQCYSKDKSLLL